ncbi:MAG TPA: ABC transporter ATP-binding protein [Candidatus Pacearchaeota archaeon]|nr:ABC transporter ATP-binding protein [Candidatus Pacearchaeota archaeon]HOK94078.1 ABC transporter ATP-binding protein [Candidatus Pacearchaeota archaeon]HPO75149.1 ABC transporter ATP-binding protein [Candidatus Pacearchaeota archaeon]
MLLALEVKNLVKYYGDFKALDGVSFEVEKGEIFGLIGPNAAGKSTTLKIIATLLSFDSGNISVFGNDLLKNRQKIRSIISYLPEEAGAYKNLSGQDYLNFIASFYSKNQEERDLLVKKAEEIADLGEKIKEKASTYSKGMIRKLLLARALMPEAKLTILDEPTSGLDVLNSIKIRNIIKKFREKGITFLISSHNMLEVEYLCDRIALIDKGKIVESGKAKDLEEKYQVQNMEEVFEKATNHYV